jgi:hypothetical protein
VRNVTATTTGKSIQPSFTGYFRHFPAAAVSPQQDQQQTDGQVALLRNLVEQLRNDLAAREENHHKREEDLRQERDRWHDAFQSAQRQLPAPSATCPRRQQAGQQTATHLALVRMTG